MAFRGNAASTEALAWRPLGAHRIAPLPQVPVHPPGFYRLSPEETGIRFTNTLTQARKLANINLMNGSGVALGDFDGDGLCDIYLCDLGGTNALYRNLGNWRFTNVTDSAGVACPKQTSTGAVFADVNGDGRVDLLVTSMGGPHACFVNLGDGRFTNTIATAGFSSRLGGTTMALADIDGNGTLDLYVANYGVTSIVRSGGALNITYENGKPVVRGRYAQRIKIIGDKMFELGEPDGLYLNDGRGNFRAVSWTDGTFRKADGSPLQESEVPWDQGLTVIFRDFNDDGAPDIYVSNDDFTPDRFWINDGQGHFQELPHSHWRILGHSAMGVDVADIDRDGRDDLFVVEMLARERHYFMTQRANIPSQRIVPGELNFQQQLRRNTLLLNRGGLDFAEAAFFSGVAASDWSWSGLFLDVDLDGWEDILVTNGFDLNADDMDVQEKIRAMGPLSVEQRRRAQLLYRPLATPNVAFRNRHDLTFEEVGQTWGFDATEISQGMAFADLDNDGDLDVVINTYNAAALVYRNEASAPRIGVRLKGKTPNSQGIGAKITVEGGPVRQSQEMICGGRYVSGDDAMRVFACGSRTNRMNVQVVWRNGALSRVDDIPANSILELNEADSQPSPARNVARHEPLFVDASALLNHTHHESIFDDFAVQPLLPHRLSQFGPGMVWTDLTGDGYDDLVIGTGTGGEVAFLQNTGKGGFERKKTPSGQNETGGLLAWKNETGQTELIVSVSNYERQSGRDLEVLKLNATGSFDVSATFPGSSAGGPLAISEVEGRIYLFQGSRFMPRSYPMPAPSHLYVRTNGQWLLDRQNEPALSSLGLVSAALWSDLDSDGTPELIVACEWGPIRIASLRSGKFAELTSKWGMERITGLWQSLAAADLDQDGRMDLVAGNWGFNCYYSQSHDKAVELFYGHFDSPERIDLFEAYFDTQLKKTVPWRDKRDLAAVWPWLNERYRTHAEYATAGVPEILQGRGSANHLRASSLASCIFFNRGDHFERVELPREAQYSTVFGLNAADFNGDGFEDLFLAQNFFPVRDLDSPLEAGRGLLLLGSTNGTYQALLPEESGIQVFGEQRGSAIADFDHDGRVDLVVSQNGNQTKLYKNMKATPGLRVSLRGSDGNLLAAGAQWRVGNAGNWGALHEIQIGSGYWSQDSSVKVVQRPSGDAKIQVRWPGGKQTEAAIPSEASEIKVSLGGGLRVVDR